METPTQHTPGVRRTPTPDHNRTNRFPPKRMFIHSSGLVPPSVYTLSSLTPESSTSGPEPTLTGTLEPVPSTRETRSQRIRHFTWISREPTSLLLIPIKHRSDPGLGPDLTYYSLARKEGKGKPVGRPRRLWSLHHTVRARTPNVLGLCGPLLLP